MSRLGDFLDERIGHRALIAHLLDEPIRGGASWAYVFGSGLLAAFGVQLATGIALMTGYAPSDKSAWASVHFIQFQQAGGWLVRGLHHFGAQAMVVLLGLHLLQVALFGAYKKPREVTWWVGLLLLALTLAFALTGYLLPWDQKGYWATRVATNIAGTVPVIGGATQRILQGGSEYGNLTLTRFYALHVGVLPLALIGLALGHVSLFRRHGVTPRRSADVARTDAFYPRQAWKDLVFAGLILFAVFGLAVREHGAPLDAPADPASDYPARPEWYFLALFELLKYFHGPFEIVGTVVLPSIVGAYLFSLPLLDRKPSTALRPRLLVLAPLFFVGLNVVLMTVQAMRQDATDTHYIAERTRADERARAANQLAMAGVPPEGPLVMLKRDPDLRGPELFDRHCASCHTLDGRGSEKDRTAPRLDAYGTASWLEAMLHDPDADTRFGRTIYKGEMPSVDVAPPGAATFRPMPPEDKAAVVAFLASVGSEQKPFADLARRGKEIVTTRCTGCHLFEGKGDDGESGIAPELAAWGTVAWVKAQIANPSSRATYREKALDRERKGHMPSFDRDLSPDDVDLLARWVQKRARATALRP